MMTAWLAEMLGYSLRPDHRQPVVAFGDVPRYRKLRRAISSRHPETHLAVSYAVEDRPSIADIIADTRSLIEWMTGLPFESLCVVVVLHHEALENEIGDPRDVRKKLFRWAAHVHVLNVDLGTGTRIDAYYAPRDWTRLREWTRTRNMLQGYRCPYAPENRRPQAMPDDEANALIEILRNECTSALVDEPSLSPEQLAEVIHAAVPEAKIRAKVCADRLVAQIKVPRVRGVIHFNYDRGQDTPPQIERRTRTLPVTAEGGKGRGARSTNNGMPEKGAPTDPGIAASPAARTNDGTHEDSPTIGQHHIGVRKPMDRRCRGRDSRYAASGRVKPELSDDANRGKTEPTRRRRTAAKDRSHRATARPDRSRTVRPGSTTGNAAVDRPLRGLLGDALKIAAGLTTTPPPEITILP